MAPVQSLLICLCRTSEVQGQFYKHVINGPGFQIDLFFRFLDLFLTKALESARIVGGIRLV